MEVLTNAGAPVNGTNEVQRLTLTGSPTGAPTGGTFQAAGSWWRDTTHRLQRLSSNHPGRPACSTDRW
jgi:hypothetical protein